MSSTVTPSRIFVGCAGWAIPSASKELFPTGGSHLSRYEQRFRAVEINSSFYRPHQPKTYARWGETAPAGFRFAVKAPRKVTHENRLRDSETEVTAFLEQVRNLGDHLGPLLFQLPPSLKFDRGEASAFFRQVREEFAGNLVLEPRHRSWLDREASALAIDLEIGIAAADPPLGETVTPAGCSSLVYYRLHGVPTMYYSAYSDDELRDLARRLQGHHRDGAEVWCIFDNTAAGAAQVNALRIREFLEA